MKMLVLVGLVGLVGCGEAKPERAPVALEGPRGTQQAQAVVSAPSQVVGEPLGRARDVMGPTEVALAVCPYVQGPLLEWLLLEDFSMWLTAADAEVAQRVRAQVLTTADEAHDTGARRFVARSTRCEVVDTRPLADGRQQVRLRQRRPGVVEPTRSFGLSVGAPLAQRVAEWEGAFAAASLGAEPEPEAVATLTLAREGERWRLDARLQKVVWQPLQRQRALDALPDLVAQRRWAAAHGALAEVCAAQSLAEVCAQWRAQVTQGAAQAAQTEPLRASLRVEVAGAPVNAHGHARLPLRITAPTDGPPLRAVWVEVRAFDPFDAPLPFVHVCEATPGASGFADATCALPALPAAAARLAAVAVEAR